MTLDMDLFCDRIEYEGSRDVSLQTMTGIHRSMGLAVPYENLDVFLGTPVDLDIKRIFEKIVRNGRGGWCYEMNGLLGAVLSQLGFDVTRILGGMYRKDRGNDAFGNHLVLRVDLDEPWIADLGIGDAILEPVRLKPGEIHQNSYRFRLEALENAEWRFFNREGATPSDFDFVDRPADEDRLQTVCNQLQSDPESVFRANLICQLMEESRVHLLVCRTFKVLGEGASTRILSSEDELLSTLENVLKITLPNVDGLWDKVCERHEVFMEIMASGDKTLDDL